MPPHPLPHPPLPSRRRSEGRALGLLALTLLAACNNDGPAWTACADDLAWCQGECADLRTNPRHCGICFHACAPTETCTTGYCECPTGWSRCDGACVDLGADPAHCGDCATACAADEACLAGGCDCPPGRTRCDGRCTDLLSDSAHCGDCATACAAAQVCTGGVCGEACGGGLSPCGADCVDLRADEAHCGDCATACTAGQTCTDGACGSSSCADGLTLCGADCVDLDYDYQHCGSCENACYPGQYCQDGVCNSRWGSCPYVYLWNGSGYDYHTDLSGSPLGSGLDFFKPEFYGANVYELGGFAAHDGLYRMRLRELVFEASYVDQAELLVVDVPEGHDVFNEWSFTSQLGRAPSRAFVTVAEPRPPRTAVADDGSDVTAAVSAADGLPLPVEPSGVSRVVVDFGPVEHPERARLLLTAWGVYADFRHRQRPPYAAGTTLETMGPDGRWQVRQVTGKAASDARTWAVDLAGLLTRDDGRLRITLAHLPSVVDVLDAVRLDDSAPVPIRITRVPASLALLDYGGAAHVEAATLTHRLIAEDDRRAPHPDARLAGRYTRYGDVRPLLEAADDRFALMAHADELFLEFPAPAPRPGTVRRAFLQADVFYTLKYHPFGHLTDSVEPLPFHGLRRYPYPAAEWPYRDDPAYARYQAEWNTREIDLSQVW